VRSFESGRGWVAASRSRSRGRAESSRPAISVDHCPALLRRGRGRHAERTRLGPAASM